MIWSEENAHLLLTEYYTRYLPTSYRVILIPYLILHVLKTGSLIFAARKSP